MINKIIIRSYRQLYKTKVIIVILHGLTETLIEEDL